MRPMTFCSAASRMAQVLMTMRSADSRPSASAQPAASSAPAISSESEWFIWQPSVQTWKRGRTWSSVRNSDTRGSSSVGPRCASRAGAGASSSTGSVRAAIRRATPMAPQQAVARPRRAPTSGDATSAYADVLAVVVAAAGGDQALLRAQGDHARHGRRVEARGSRPRGLQAPSPGAARHHRDGPARCGEWARTARPPASPDGIDGLARPDALSRHVRRSAVGRASGRTRPGRTRRARPATSASRHVRPAPRRRRRQGQATRTPRRRACPARRRAVERQVDARRRGRRAVARASAASAGSSASTPKPRMCSSPCDPAQPVLVRSPRRPRC